MANWLNQLQSLLGQSSSSTSSSADQGLGKLLVPGALGGLAGLLVANKSARKLLTKYGTNALLVGGGAVAGTVLLPELLPVPPQSLPESCGAVRESLSVSLQHYPSPSALPSSLR